MDYREVIDLIPFINPVSRWELKEMAGMSDRRVRHYIQKAREDGELIVNMQDGSGYMRVTEEDLPILLRQYKANEARMISLSKQQKTLRKILKEGGKL